MLDAPRVPSRPWRVIAAEVANETDSIRLLKLVEELNRAMAQQGIGSPKKDLGREHPDGLSKTA